MPSEMEFVTFKNFVKSLNSTENPTSSDKSIVCNDTDGPRSAPASEAAITNAVVENDFGSDSYVKVKTSDGWKKLSIGRLVHSLGMISSTGTYSSFNDLPPRSFVQVSADLNDSPDDARRPWGVCITIAPTQDAQNRAQIFIEASSTAKYNGQMYYRVRRSGTWSAWKKNADTSVTDSLKTIIDSLSVSIEDILLTDEKTITSLFSFSISSQIVAEKSNANYGNAASSTNFKCCDFVDISAYHELTITCIVRPYTGTAFSGLVFYDKNKNPIEGHYYTDDSIASDAGYSSNKTFKIPAGTKYVRTTIFSDSSTFGTNTITFACVAKTKSLEYLEKIIDSVLGSASNLNSELFSEFSVISVPNYPHHDATFSETTNKVYAFNKYLDGVGGELKVYDTSFNEVKTGIRVHFVETLKDETTNSMQMKNVDCNLATDYLICGNGQASYSPDDSYVYVFYDWLDWENAESEVNFSTCGRYKKFDFTELGVKSYAWWLGKNPTNDLIILNVNFFHDFYLVRLGKGTNELSNGTYEATSDDLFNGTWEILKHWEAEDKSNELAQHGGQFWNGSLYLVNNDQYTNEIYKVILRDNGVVKFDVINAKVYSSDNKMLYRFIDGMFIRDGYMYGAPLILNGTYHTNSNKVVLKIKVP